MGAPLDATLLGLADEVLARARRDGTAGGEATPFSPDDLSSRPELAPLESYGGPAPWPDPLGEDAYHGLVGRIVRAIEPQTEADPAAVLLQLLVTFGNLVGRRAFFRVGGDYHHTTENVVLVGDSSKGRKGTSLSANRALARGVDETWERDHIQSGLSSGEGLVWAVRDAIQRHEPIREKGHVTGYQDVEVDAGVTDKRLLVVEPEFASVLRVLARDGNTLSAILRQAWDSGNLRVMTKNSPAVATGAHISLIGHITRDELLRYLSDTEAGNGFGNRILWVAVRRSRYLPDGGALDEGVLGPLAHELGVAVDFARRAGEMCRDDEARDAWHHVYRELSDGYPGLMGAMIARAEAHVLRLSMLYALLDRSAVIRKEHLLAALAVWEYCEASARWIFGEKLGDPTADEILAKLRAHPKGLPRDDLRNHFSRHKSAAEITRGLGILAGLGKARMERNETEGRPEERWFAT